MSSKSISTKEIFIILRILTNKLLIINNRLKTYRFSKWILKNKLKIYKMGTV